MKRIIILFISLFFIGCSNNKLNISNIQSITYNDINLLEEDFENIKNSLNQLIFQKKDISKNDNKVLKIVSKNFIYNFSIVDNNIYYEENGKTYISIEGKHLINKLNKLKTEYTDFSFFNISYDKCTTKTDELLIKIDNTAECLTINTNKQLYNFKINLLENIDDNINDISLFYQKDHIDNNIMIKYIVSDKSRIRISFDTKYNYNISIVPIYNQDKKVNLNYSYKQKR